MAITNTKPDTNCEPINFLYNVIENKLGGYINDYQVEIPHQKLYTLGNFESQIIPCGPATINMTVTFPLPLKSKESLSNLQLPEPPPKVVKEKLTDEEIIEKYNQIMAERSEKNKELDFDNDWVEIEI